MQRNLDGIFYRVNRCGEWKNICYSDMTQTERELTIINQNKDYWKKTAEHLADCLKAIGNQFDIVYIDEYGYTQNRN